MYRLFAANHANVDEIWPALYPLIVPLEKQSRGQLSADSVYQEVRGAGMWLWFVFDDTKKKIVAVFGQRFVIDADGTKRAVFMFSEGADWSKWAPEIIPEWIDQLKGMGVGVIGGIMRPGYERLLAPFGFKRDHHVVLELDLNVE